MSSREPEIDYYVASTITCSDGGQVIFICGQKLVKTFDCLLYILRNISLVGGERLSLHASTGGKQWSPGTATVAAMLSLSLSPSLTYTFGKVLSSSIPLWQSFPFLPKFFKFNIIPIWFQNRSHIDAQESAMLISVQTFPQTLGNQRAEETGAPIDPS